MDREGRAENMKFPFEELMPYRIAAIIVLAVFYGIYFAKMPVQRRHGIETRHLARGKILARANGCNKRYRNKHVRLYVKRGHKPDNRFCDYRNTAQDNCGPCNVKREGLKSDQAANDRDPGNGKQYDILFLFRRAQTGVLIGAGPFS